MVRQLTFVLKLVTFIFPLAICDPDPPGHMKPLGHHMPPIATPIEILHQFPTPQIFYEKYVKTAKPILFKGILESGIQPAYKLWTDEYLREHHGSEMVEVEFGKKENRSGNMDAMLMSHFLNKYKTDDLYMVHDSSDKMKAEVNVPPTLQCGGFQNVLQNLIMWLSSGGTKSVLHNDSYDNINCILDGEKYLVMIDKVHNEQVEADHWNADQSCSKVDVERVDMYKFPNLRNIPWYEVTIRKGDCLYIPFSWYHHVDSKQGRNFAINFWFNKLLWFNYTDCEGVDQEKLKPKPATEFKFSLGAYEPREGLLSMFEGLAVITEKEFLEGIKEYTTNKVEKEEIIKFFQFIDSNGDGKISPEECLSFEVKEANKLYPDLLKYASQELDDEQEGGDDEQDEKDDSDNDNTNDIDQAKEEEKDEMDIARDKFQQAKKLHISDEL